MWFKNGAIIGIIATVPLVVLCAVAYRFPVPFAGYLSGIGAIIPSLIAVLFYGILFGGFLVQALLGGLGGLLAQHIGGTDKNKIINYCIVFSTIGASFGVLILAILDKIIGPW